LSLKQVYYDFFKKEFIKDPSSNDTLNEENLKYLITSKHRIYPLKEGFLE